MSSTVDRQWPCHTELASLAVFVFRNIKGKLVVAFFYRGESLRTNEMGFVIFRRCSWNHEGRTGEQLTRSPVDCRRQFQHFAFTENRYNETVSSFESGNAVVNSFIVFVASDRLN